MNKSIWVVMFSRNQNATHIERLYDTVEASWRQIREDLYNDYIMVGAFPKIEEAEKHAVAFRAVWDKKLSGGLK